MRGKHLAQGDTTLELPHIPQLYSWVDWSNVDKVLSQGNNNNKQPYPGIKPGSSGSEANPNQCSSSGCPKTFVVLLLTGTRTTLRIYWHVVICFVEMQVFSGIHSTMAFPFVVSLKYTHSCSVEPR